MMVASSQEWRDRLEEGSAHFPSKVHRVARAPWFSLVGWPGPAPLLSYAGDLEH